MNSNLIDWMDVWNKFDEYMQDIQPVYCKECHVQQTNGSDEWENQRQKITSIVNKMHKFTPNQWKSIWIEFADWIEENTKKCSTCSSEEYADWDDQTIAIQNIIQGRLVVNGMSPEQDWFYQLLEEEGETTNYEERIKKLMDEANRLDR